MESPGERVLDRCLESLGDLMGHEAAEKTWSFHAVFEQDDLGPKHDHFSVG